MWKPATSFRGWQCPSCPCIQHSVQLMPFVSTQLPNRSLALSLSLHLYSSSLILTPCMVCLSNPPHPASQLRSPPITAPLILRAGVSGGTSLGLRVMVGNGEGGDGAAAKWGSIRRRGWGMAPVMGREVEEDGGEEMPLLPHQVKSHVWYSTASPPSVECCQQHDMRLGYTLQWWFIGMRIKCPALLKTTLLTN